MLFFMVILNICNVNFYGQDTKNQLLNFIFLVTNEIHFGIFRGIQLV